MESRQPGYMLGPSAAVFLGEYPSDVRRVQVRDPDKVVWQIDASERPAQFHWFSLKLGTNDSALTHVYAGKYKTTAPANAPTFSLLPGVRYEILVWDHFGWASRGVCTMP